MRSTSPRMDSSCHRDTPVTPCGQAHLSQAGLAYPRRDRLILALAVVCQHVALLRRRLDGVLQNAASILVRVTEEPLPASAHLEHGQLVLHSGNLQILLVHVRQVHFFGRLWCLRLHRGRDATGVNLLLYMQGLAPVAPGLLSHHHWSSVPHRTPRTRRRAAWPRMRGALPCNQAPRVAACDSHSFRPSYCSADAIPALLLMRRRGRFNGDCLKCSCGDARGGRRGDMSKSETQFGIASLADGMPAPR